MSSVDSNDVVPMVHAMSLPKRHRRAVRGLVLASSGRVLLMQMRLPWLGPVWLCPGGGLQEGEPKRAALRRELLEETGLTLGPKGIGPALWRRQLLIEHDGAEHHMDETYLLVQTDEFEPAPTELTERERDWFMGFKWWWPAEIIRSEERFAPPELGRQLMLRGVKGFGPVELLPARVYRAT